MVFRSDVLPRQPRPFVNLSLRFSKDELPVSADRYHDPREERIISDIVPRSKKNQCFSREDFLIVCHWKNPTGRNRHHCERNAEVAVRDVTHLALTTESQELRISLPTVLMGVQWPVASALLHVVHSETIHYWTIVPYGRLVTISFQAITTLISGGTMSKRVALSLQSAASA